MFGFLNLAKPPGPTSHDIVALVRRLVPKKSKIGHAGTLDPLADGVLVICVGPATRLADYVQSQSKRYVAEVMLGATSTTDDSEGQVQQLQGVRSPTEQEIRGVLTRFVGQVEQVPPAHSAVHLGGQRAYKIARRGESPDIPARKVEIHSIELLKYEYPRLSIDVRCGRGTYIRSLARDIGAALGVGGYCSRLTRTAVGPFKIEEAISPERLDPQRDIVSPLVALESLPKITVDEADARRLAMGQSVTAGRSGRPSCEVAVVTEQGRLIAIAKIDPDGKALHPTKVFPLDEP